MKKEAYEKPKIRKIHLDEDVIVYTSGCPYEQCDNKSTACSDCSSNTV